MQVVGDVKVVWDEDVDGYRIIFTNIDGGCWLNHVLVQTARAASVTGTLGGKSRPGVSWEAQDFATSTPARRRFTLLFGSGATRDEFLRNFNQARLFLTPHLPRSKQLRLQGLEVAKSNNLTEMDPREGDLEARSVAHIAALNAVKAAGPLPDFALLAHLLLPKLLAAAIPVLFAGTREE